MQLDDMAAIAYSLLTVVVVAFQLALALGAPWGAYSMGGAFPGRFPPPIRAAAVLQAILLALMAAIVLSRAGLAMPMWSRASHWLIWVVVAFGVISVLLNGITRSSRERRIWLPVTVLLLSFSIAVLLSAR